MRIINKKVLFILLAVLSWSIFITCSFVIGRHSMGDFSPVYIASKLTNYSRDTRLHMYDHSKKQFNASDSEIITRLAEKEGIFAKTYTPYVYPPFFAWQIKPLTYMNFWNARIIILIILFLTITAGTYFSYKAVNNNINLKLFILVAPILLLCFYPVNETIHLGQTTALVFMLLSLSLYLIHRKHFVWAGICLGYCICLKISPALIVAALAVCGLFTTILSALATVLILIGGGALIFGPELTARYLYLVAEISAKGTMPAWNNASIQAMLLRFTRPLAGIFEWVQQPVPAYLMIIEKLIILLLFTAACAVVAYYIRNDKKNRVNDRTAVNYIFSFALLLMLFSAPISWNHYQLYTIIPLMLALSEILIIKDKKIRLYLIITLCFSYLLIAVDPTIFAHTLYEGRHLFSYVGFSLIIFSAGIIGALLLYCLLCISLFIRTRQALTPQQGEMDAQQHDLTVGPERTDLS